MSNFSWNVRFFMECRIFRGMSVFVTPTFYSLPWPNNVKKNLLNFMFYINNSHFIFLWLSQKIQKRNFEYLWKNKPKNVYFTFLHSLESVMQSIADHIKLNSHEKRRPCKRCFEIASVDHVTYCKARLLFRSAVFALGNHGNIFGEQILRHLLRQIRASRNFLLAAVLHDVNYLFKSQN